MCTIERPHHRQRGFTLLELIVFIVVVAVGMAGILGVMDNVVRNSADPMVRKQTLAIAESLLEEILLKDATNPATDGYTGTVRAYFDDVGDYNGYTTTAGVVDLLGNAPPALAAYNIAPPVSVTDSTELGGLATKKVTVSVTGPGGTVTLVGHRGPY
jgi:MSHA pilin protein MshD